jgi:hypothetical protein
MNLGAKTKWELAGKLAARMLPQVFKPQSPVFELAFAPEHQRELERLLAALPTEVFKASDSLGWVYQFWQAKRKDEVNASEVKIGADELPAVTQLFTEPYMVDVPAPQLAGRLVADAPPWRDLSGGPGPTCARWRTARLPPASSKAGPMGSRTSSCSTPAAAPATSSSPPSSARAHAHGGRRPQRDGSGGCRAIADNLHGLELDPRCVEIAAFALALAAWSYPDENGDPLGVRADMPAPQVACCGLKVAAKPEDWMALVPDDAANAAYLRQELRLLHASFAQAPLLGSLLDPARSLKNDLATSSFDTLRDLLERALATERPVTLWGQASELQDDSWDLALTAKGLLDAARLLDGRYHLAITNVPYLGMRKQSEELRDYCEKHYKDSKADLASVMTQRCLELLQESGFAFVVTQSAVGFKSYFESFRKYLLDNACVRFLVPLGTGAFSSISGEVVDVSLLGLLNSMPDVESETHILDVQLDVYEQKIANLPSMQLTSKRQGEFLQGPGFRIQASFSTAEKRLSDFAICPQGIKTGDDNKWLRRFFESNDLPGWQFMQSSCSISANYAGCEWVINWFTVGSGMIRPRLDSPAIGRFGIGLSQTGSLRSSIYMGHRFDSNVAPIIPIVDRYSAAVIAFCQSEEFAEAIGTANPGLFVTNSAFLEVPFDLSHWQKVAAERYPNGLPKPYSDDPTQWLFHGHPQPATDPLQVAVARLAGYRWPAETKASMELADEARTWIARCDKLAEHTDDDGIICLPSVRGEPAAHDRLLKLLISAWETVQPGSWKPTILDKLLADADSTGKSLEVWLREKFFEQHAKRFHHRPFIWHVWDGLKDGFGALVNYHQLDAKNLERLIHTYLGDWIRQQEAGVREGIDGAQTRLAAAQDLKRRLELILEGEPPYDIFVRWKPLAEQPIGWNPDLNDGVRLNIRPFMTAEVLRHNKKPKLNVTWDKDRGKDVASAPWFKVFKGDRINDHHLTVAEKRAAREGK